MNESDVIFLPKVALHPEWTIVACVFLTLLSCVGIVNFSPKSDTLSLWIPETSVSRKYSTSRCFCILCNFRRLGRMSTG